MFLYTYPTNLAGLRRMGGCPRCSGPIWNMEDGDRRCLDCGWSVDSLTAVQPTASTTPCEWCGKSKGAASALDPQSRVATVRPGRVLSDADRAAALGARKANAAARRASILRRNFKDARNWQRLASARGLTLPPWGKPVTPGAMEHWLREVGVPIPAYLEWAGEQSLRDFAVNNPNWPLRAWVGTWLGTSLLAALGKRLP